MATTIGEFITGQYLPLYVAVEPLKAREMVEWEAEWLRKLVGELPVGALEGTAPADAVRAELPGRSLATVNRRLARLRHLTAWGVSRGVLAKSPFGRHGVRIQNRKETQRNRRVTPDEQAALLAAFEGRSNGELLAARFTASLETCLRKGELLGLQNKDVNLVRAELVLPATKTKSGKARRIPFDPNGAVAAFLTARAALGPLAFPFGDEAGKRVTTFDASWHVAVLRANGIEPTYTDRGKLTAEALEALQSIDLHWHDLRHEGATRLLEGGLDPVEIQTLLGHATLEMTRRYLSIQNEGVARSLRAYWDRRRAA